jgi:hypothetical protein
MQEMNNHPIRFGIALVALCTSSLAANAAVLYVSDCAVGADAACVPGNDSNSGTEPTKPRRSLAGFSLKNLADGEQVIAFARGSVIEIDGMLYPINLGKKATQSLVFTDYKPSWGGTALPIIRFKPSSTGNHAGINLINAGSNFTFRNLDITGSGAPNYYGTGLFLHGNVSNVLLENVTLRNFSLGINSANSKTDARVENVTVRNSRIVNNHAQGFLGGGYKVVLEDNIFDNNGFKGGYRYHNIYLSTYAEDMVLRGNTLTNSAMVDGRCTGVSLVGHNHLVRTLIENNTIVELTANYGCYGIQINGYQSSTNAYMGFDGTVIRGNTVVLGLDGGLGIGVNACPDCVIENNVIVGVGKSNFTGIAVPDGSFTSAGSKDKAVTVRNNSIYINTPTGTTHGIAVNSPESSQDKVVSNLIYFGPGSRPEAKCFKTGGRSLSSYAAFGNNVCFREGGPNRWSDQHDSLAAAHASGWADDSMNIDPLLSAVPSAANQWRMIVQTGSPAINAGSRTFSAAKDALNLLRDALPDVGAYENGNKPPPVPGAPTGIVIQ